MVMSLAELVAASKPTTASLKAVQSAQATPTTAAKVANPFQTGIPKPANTGFNYGLATPLISIGGAITQASAEAGAKQVYQGVNQTVGGVKNYSLPQIGEGALNTVAGAINAISAPLNATIFAPLSPAVDYAADKLSNTKALKEFGAGSIDTPANQQTTTEREVQAILNAFTIAGTFAGGLKFGEKAPLPKEPVSTITTPELAKTIQEKMPELQYGRVYDIAERAKGKTPTEQNAFIESELKNIRPKSLQAFSQPIERATAAETTPRLAANEHVAGEPPITEAPKTRTTSTIKPIEGTGQVKTRGLSQNVEATAIEKKLTDNFGDLPEYRQVSMKEQAAQAADFMAKDAEGARAVAMGQKAAPKGLLPESVFVATEQKAIAEGDVQTLRDLANSKLAGAATTMGQRIRTLGERDSASPLHAIQEVQRAREAALAKRGETTATTVERVRSAIRKTNTKETWGEFVNSITC